MTETKTTEVQELDQEIRELETEAAAPVDLSWDEIVELSAEEISARETRKSVLPRMIQARKAKKLQLEVDLLRGELAEACDVNEKAYEAFEAQDEKLRKAKERRDQAWSTWQIQQGVFINAEQRLRRIEKHLRELEEGPA